MSSGTDGSRGQPFDSNRARVGTVSQCGHENRQVRWNALTRVFVAVLLAGVVVPAASAVPRFNGNLLTATLPSGNGCVEAQTFDRADLTGTSSEMYKYDLADHITEACFKASGAASTKNTDPFVRWTYDNNGNRLTENRSGTTTTSAFNNADQLTAKGSTAYTYDLDGQETVAGSRSFVWNVAGQATSSTLSGSTVTYAFDGDNARVSSVVGATTTKYLWDKSYGLPQLALERDGSNSLLRRWVTGLDTVSMATPAASFYLHHDYVGSVVNVTNNTGVTQWTRQYEPFGVKRSETNNSGSAPVEPLQYTGEYVDSTTSLYNLRARQYDPSTGRFLSEDPVPQEITDPYVSAYLYVNNRPTMLTDPSGMCWRWSCDWLSGAVSTATDVVVGVGQFAAHPIRMTQRLRRQLNQAYRDGGGGWRGALDALNQLNPGYYTLLSGDSCFTSSALDGNSNRAKACGAALTNGLLTVAAAVGGEAGAAKLLKTWKTRRTPVGAKAAKAERGVAGALRACTPNSFVAGTTVLMADGSRKAIEDVRVGERVMAADPATGESGARTVVRLIRHRGVHRVVAVRFSDLSRVVATARHPFWDVTQRSWVNAEDLATGDVVQTHSGELLTVSAVSTTDRDVVAYNFTVEGLHTYFVGSTPVLVHNSGCTSMADLPASALRNLTEDADFAFKRLSGNHGVTRVEFREQIHAIKKAWDLPADFNVKFGPTGDVWNPSSGDLIGSIVHVR